MESLIYHRRFGVASIGNDGIAHVPNRARLARNVPPTPTFRQWAAMVGNVVAEPRHRCAIRRRELATNQHAGNIHRVTGVVAGQAVVVAHELRFLHRRLVQHVENDALPRVLCGYFDKATTDPTNHDRIVEKKCAWVLWVYSLCLNAGF